MARLGAAGPRAGAALEARAAFALLSAPRPLLPPEATARSLACGEASARTPPPSWGRDAGCAGRAGSRSRRGGARRGGRGAVAPERSGEGITPCPRGGEYGLVRSRLPAWTVWEGAAATRPEALRAGALHLSELAPRWQLVPRHLQPLPEVPVPL